MARHRPDIRSQYFNDADRMSMSTRTGRWAMLHTQKKYGLATAGHKLCCTAWIGWQERRGPFRGGTACGSTACISVLHWRGTAR